VRHIEDQDDRDHQKDEMQLEAQAVLRCLPALEDEDDAIAIECTAMFTRLTAPQRATAET